MLKKLLAVLALIFLVASPAFAAAVNPQKATAKDRCPVCGMFVAKYPDFAAQLRFRDGSTQHFDGAKDLLKFYLDLKKYAPGRKTADVAAVFVTDYYTLSFVDAKSAVYVSGSDVLGPMGRELIPFAKTSEAREFMRDHRGKSVHRFNEITPAVVVVLDR